MALRALTTFFHEALGSDWSQESMAARRRELPCLVSSIFKRSGYFIPSWTPKVIVSDQVRSYSSRDRSGSFGLASDIPPSPSLPLVPFLSSSTFMRLSMSSPRGSPLPPQAYEISNLAKDFGISREISGLLQRFPDFQISRDFWERFLGEISGISDFAQDFWDFPWDFVGFQDFNGTQ